MQKEKSKSSKDMRNTYPTKEAELIITRKGALSPTTSFLIGEIAPMANPII